MSPALYSQIGATRVPNSFEHEGTSFRAILGGYEMEILVVAHQHIVTRAIAVPMNSRS